MITTEYSFSTEEEIDAFLEDLFKSNKAVSLENIHYRADRMLFDTNPLRDYFTAQGKKLLTR